MMTERKLFTAEIKRLQQRSEGGPSASNSEVLKAIRELRDEVKAVATLVRGDQPPPAEPSIEDSMPQKAAEVAMLKTELRALAVCIEHTKAEIAALKPRETEEDRLVTVAFELDAIVSSTERATEQILEAAEKIEAISTEIQAHAADGYVSRLVADITDTIGSIFEACNFQDITGQRITKVVKTLKYVEERIMSMIEIWGPENIADVSPKIFDEHRDDDSKLLNGPALENQGISQAEIDSLFG